MISLRKKQIAIFLLLCCLSPLFAESSFIAKMNKQFNSSLWYERNGAYMAIGETQNSQYAQLIVENLKKELRLYSKDKTTFRTIKSRAGMALANMGRDIIPTLLDALRDADSRLAEPYIYALGKFQASNSVQLIGKQSRNKDPELRAAVMKALGEIRSKKGLRFLHTGLRDSVFYVQIEAINAIGKIKDYNSGRKLIALLRSRKEKVREAAAQALGNMKYRAAIPALTYALLRKRCGYDAAEALGKIGGAKAKRALIRSLYRYRDYTLKMIALSLAKIGGRDVVWPLLRAEWRFRKAYALKEYVQALSKIRDRRVVAKLKKYFAKDEVMAAEGIARILGKRAVPYLLWKYRKASHIYTKLHIARAIAISGDTRYIKLFTELLEKDDLMAGNWLVYHLGGLKEKAIPVLLPFIKKYQTKWKRYTALKALAETGDIRAIPILLNEVKNWNINIQTTAVKGLGNCRNREGVPTLRKILANPNAHTSLVKDALESLVKILGDEAKDELRTATTHKSAKVRKLAYHLLWTLEKR